ncbi:MAG TPA: CPBP family intramembrane glutamic endopeptidase [Acidimicrobiia bacterium]|nr:CPBP family intramembrane glutamic endopeptidase [Acidimicrobiia bacterium]
MARREAATDTQHLGAARGWSWQWVQWASWPVTPLVLVVAGAAVAVDVASAWIGEPEWYLGRILISPALPLALVLVLLVGPRRIGCSRESLAAWREFLAVTGLAIAGATIAYAHSIAGWREVEGVVVTAAGEEVVYRLGALLLVGAACARLAGRDWRDTAKWGTGPVVGGLLGAALSFSVLPGHVEQMSGVGSVVPFASLAVLLGYVALRTGSIVPCVFVHVLLDLTALAFFAGSITAATRLAVACTLLVGLAMGMMPAGRRLGLRRRVPSVIDLRSTDDASAEPAGPSLEARTAALLD